jgi:branched-chain amino acid aminotransferase
MPELAIFKIIISEKDILRLDKVTFKSQPTSLNSASRMLPKGVYTTLRTYEGSKVLPLQDHIKRLEISAKLLGHNISSQKDIFYKSLQIAVKDYLPGDSRVRFTVDLETCPGEIFLSIERLHLPSPRDYAEGVITATCPVHRENPESKNTAFIETAEGIRQKMPLEVHECLLLNEQGQILEGLSSNFFYVREGVVRTASEGILPGITRSLVINAAAAADLPVLLEAAHISDVTMMQEAFITSSTRSVLPVSQIDSTIIGLPGQITKMVQASLWNIINGQLVDLLVSED